jgi:hypothetical protein
MARYTCMHIDKKTGKLCGKPVDEPGTYCPQHQAKIEKKRDPWEIDPPIKLANRHPDLSGPEDRRKK